MTTELPGWLADPALGLTWQRVRARFEGNGLVATGRTRVELGSREERHAVSALLGTSCTRDRVSVDLASLDARLRERSGIGGLADVLPLLTGARLSDLPAQRAARLAGREEPLELARTLVQGAWVDTWVSGLRRTGLLTNRKHAETIVRQAALVLSELLQTGFSAEGPRSRVQLAAQVIGDAHALDEDRLLHQVVLRGLAAASGQVVPASAAQRRELWEAYAVSPDLLSRTCLTVGLVLAGAEPLARRLRVAADAGDPVHVTGWDLNRTSPRWQPDHLPPVLVCENPRVLEAVAEEFAGSQPVVCTSGEPNRVVTSVLRRLSDAGQVLRYHGDFDWPGIAIANRVVARFDAEPWLMGAADYEQHVRRDGPALSGTVVEPSWDAELGAAMRAAGCSLHEESVLPQILDGLRAAAKR